jgi:hypothetical protein
MITYTMSETRLGRIKDCLKKISEANNDGDILEFGVFEGYSISEMRLNCSSFKMNNRIIGLDSFKGLPESDGPWHKGGFCSSLETTKSNLNERLKNLNDIILVEGFYSDTLTDDLVEKLSLEKAALIHIDSDLYSSAIEVLTFCKKLFRPGTFIVFDEWEEDVGEGKAWKEFIAKNEDVRAKDLGQVESQRIFQITE